MGKPCHGLQGERLGLGREGEDAQDTLGWQGHSVGGEFGPVPLCMLVPVLDQVKVLE